MVGDGINDAPALGHILASSLEQALIGYQLVRHCAYEVRSQTLPEPLSFESNLRNIKQNLWALFYNAICIPAWATLAPLGATLNPMI